MVGASALVTLALVTGCGSGSGSTEAGESASTADGGQQTAGAKSDAGRPHRQMVKASELTAKQPAKRVMQCIKLEGGFIEPLAPTRRRREPPSRSFAHGVGPNETHVAIYLGTSPGEIDRWIKEYDQLDEYHAMKTPDGRNLILVDGYPNSNDRQVAFHCVGVATS
jgi:hypothetical protein